MASRQQHKQRALDNEQFSRSLSSGTQYLDWAVVGLFYSALHFVEAYLDKAESLGGKTVMPVTVIPGMVTLAMFSDPTGNVVGMVSSDTPPA